MELDRPTGAKASDAGAADPAVVNPGLRVLEEEADRLASMMLLGLRKPEQEGASPQEVRELVTRIAGGAERLSLQDVLRQSRSLLSLEALHLWENMDAADAVAGSRAEGFVSDGPPADGPVLDDVEQALALLHEALSVELEALRQGGADPLKPGASGAMDKVGQSTAESAMGSSFGLGDDIDLLREFLVEATGHLEAIESGALALETDLADRETLNLLFRAFHSIKGLAGFLEIGAIQHTAHELENLLDSARDGVLQLDRDAIDLMLDTHSNLSEALGLVADRVEGKAVAAITEDPQLLARITAYPHRTQGNGAPRADGVDVVDAMEVRAFAVEAHVHAEADVHAEEDVPDEADPEDETDAPDAVDGTGTCTAPQAGAEPVVGESATVALPTGTAVTTPRAVVPAKPPATPPAPQPASDGATERGASAARTNAAGAVVKIDTEKLDYLVDMVGELVIAQSMVRHDPLFENSQSATLLKNMAQMTRVTAEVQRVAMSMRMVPIKGLFQRMSRLARDLARKYGKNVRVELEGEETELDRTLIEQLADPMMHMVRNAIDHGLEDAAQRVASGKAAEGVIKLSAVHQSGSILISIEDDGKGLDRKRILEKAKSRGLVHENATLTDAQIDQLIFEPGFSTATVVSDLSGRGVGMDVVRRNIQQLRGRVEVQSQPGLGAAMRMKLPLTLAIIDGLVVGVNGERFIIPLFSVREMFRADPKAISRVQDGQEVLQVRGNILPVVRLRRRLKLSAKPGEEESMLCLVVESARSVYCLLVDEFVGKQEVVIKSLGEQFAEIPGIAAGAILGDGTVGLILDMEGVFEGVSSR